MHSIAPMLIQLGYDPNKYPPNYGQPDKIVAENTLHVKNNEEYWNRKAESLNISQFKTDSVDPKSVSNQRKVGKLLHSHKVSPSFENIPVAENTKTRQ